MKLILPCKRTQIPMRALCVLLLGVALADSQMSGTPNQPIAPGGASVAQAAAQLPLTRQENAMKTPDPSAESPAVHTGFKMAPEQFVNDGSNDDELDHGHLGEPFALPPGHMAVRPGDVCPYAAGRAKSAAQARDAGPASVSSASALAKRELLFQDKATGYPGILAKREFPQAAEKKCPYAAGNRNVVPAQAGDAAYDDGYTASKMKRGYDDGANYGGAMDTETLNRLKQRAAAGGCPYAKQLDMNGAQQAAAVFKRADAPPPEPKKCPYSSFLAPKDPNAPPTECPYKKQLGKREDFPDGAIPGGFHFDHTLSKRQEGAGAIKCPYANYLGPMPPGVSDKDCPYKNFAAKRDLMGSDYHPEWNDPALLSKRQDGQAPPPPPPKGKCPYGNFLGKRDVAAKSKCPYAGLYGTSGGVPKPAQ